MFSRIFSSGLLIILVGACNSAAPTPAEFAGKDALRISCGFGEVSQTTDTCIVETSQVDGNTVLTVWHPDGGFHRLQVVADGYAAFDGADEAYGGLNGREVEVSIGNAHYMLPVPSLLPVTKGANPEQP